MVYEKKTFGAEVDKILHIMIHSLYTNKEIFMRELISNASDACDKLRYLSQITPDLLGNDTTFKITVRIDKDNRNIIIRDNGIGFDMKYNHRIFEIFERLHRQEDYPGTGIGLALVKKAMQRMGGQVWAYSIPGEGATFYLQLPIMQENLT